MADSKTRKIAAGFGALMASVCIASALIHFNDWTKNHDPAVRLLMYFSAMAAIACFLFWYFTAEQSHGTPKSSNSAGRDNLGSQINATGSVVHQGDVYYHGPPLPLDPPDPKPNLILSGPEPCHLRFDGMCWRVGGRGTVPGSIFWIHNKPAARGHQAGRALDVSVSLDFKIGLTSIAHVARSCWIDHKENGANIEVGDRKGVLVATFYGLALKVYENKTDLDNRIRFATSMHHKRHFPILRNQDVSFGSGSLIEIDVTVLSDGETLAERSFKCIKTPEKSLMIV
jgi:hypothetical protein